MAPPTLPPHVAREAFMSLDQFYEQQRSGQRSRARPQTRPQYQAYRPPRERTIDSVQAARVYGGMMICEHYAKNRGKKSSFGKAYY
uniref:Uncharacterized protein n=1 Tax=Chenopodium quinoa TaxID=63459 RepID=A0A803LLG4_CHEQI